MARDESRRCALVTGASRGIGAATARGLAEAGWAVGINYRADADRATALTDELSAAGHSAHPVQGDVTDAAQLEAVFADLEERYGRVLVLVNNVGMLQDNLVTYMADEEWDEVLATNLQTVFRATKRAIPGMLRARWGRIVNVSSVAALHGNVGQANYAAAKAGVLGFSRVVAGEVGRRGVTINSVAPGLIETEMVEHVPREMMLLNPMRRTGTPEEVAAAICFLASPAASYINGATLVVDGGLSA